MLALANPWHGVVKAAAHENMNQQILYALLVGQLSEHSGKYNGALQTVSQA